MRDLMTILTKSVKEKNQNTLLEEEQTFDFKLHNYTDAVVDFDSFMRDLEVSDRVLYKELNDYIIKHKKTLQKNLVKGAKPKAKPKTKERSSTSGYYDTGGCGSSRRSNGSCGWSSPNWGSGGCGSSRSSGGC